MKLLFGLVLVSVLLLGCTTTKVECPDLPDTYVKECITWAEPTWEQVSTQRGVMDNTFQRKLDLWNDYGEKCLPFAKEEQWEEYERCKRGDYTILQEFYGELGCVVTYVNEYQTNLDCSSVYKGTCLRYEYVRDGVGA